MEHPAPSDGGEAIVLDLASVQSKLELLSLLGATFEFGGPDGNLPVRTPNANRGWGMNWDALLDSLTSLPEGGIWGTSPRFRFPLRLVLDGSRFYRERDPEGFAIFLQILEDARVRYAEDGLVFEYELPS